MLWFNFFSGSKIFKTSFKISNQFDFFKTSTNFLIQYKIFWSSTKFLNQYEIFWSRTNFFEPVQNFLNQYKIFLNQYKIFWTSAKFFEPVQNFFEPVQNFLNQYKRFWTFVFDAKTKKKWNWHTLKDLYWFKIFVLVQNIWYWFKKFVLVQNFFTGSENLVPRVKIELQHICNFKLNTSCQEFIGCLACLEFCYNQFKSTITHTLNHSRAS